MSLTWRRKAMYDEYSLEQTVLQDQVRGLWVNIAAKHLEVGKRLIRDHFKLTLLDSTLYLR